MIRGRDGDGGREGGREGRVLRADGAMVGGKREGRGIVDGAAFHPCPSPLLARPLRPRELAGLARDFPGKGGSRGRDGEMRKEGRW